MLERLRPRTVIDGDDEQAGVDLSDADEHVADEPIVAGHVDEVERVPRRRDVGVPDVDRQAAPLLLGQAVGVDAGQRAQEGRLAVVDVTRGPDDPVIGASASPSARPAPLPAPRRRTGSTVRRSRTTARPRCAR